MCFVGSYVLRDQRRLANARSVPFDKEHKNPVEVSKQPSVSNLGGDIISTTSSYSQHPLKTLKTKRIVVCVYMVVPVHEGKRSNIWRTRRKAHVYHEIPPLTYRRYENRLPNTTTANGQLPHALFFASPPHLPTPYLHLTLL